jgi:hypothetical protein
VGAGRFHRRASYAQRVGQNYIVDFQVDEFGIYVRAAPCRPSTVAEGLGDDPSAALDTAPACVQPSDGRAVGSLGSATDGVGDELGAARRPVPSA